MEINRNNYETFFLLYVDRELNLSDMKEVEKFADENADLQREFSLLRQTVLVPAQTEFNQKELLFRKEDKRRVIPIYWSRIAAAVAVLVFGGWLITSQLQRKQGVGIVGSESRKNAVTVKQNSSDQKIKDADNNKADLPGAGANRIQPAIQQNIAATKNQSAGNNGTVKNRIKAESDIPGKNNPVHSPASAHPDLQNLSSGEIPDGTVLVMQKSSVQELQPADSRTNMDPKQISAQPGNHSPGLLVASSGTAENIPHLRDENAAFAENEDQTDNAISVVALNDKNKGITRLFKKLTRRAPTVENDRKVRVSVFQFSY